MEVLYNTSAAFDPSSGREFLRGLRPQVLRPDAIPRGELDLGRLYVVGMQSTAPTLKLCTTEAEAAATSEDWQELRVYNPSIATAPRGLCPRCAYAAAVRIDALHQCPNGSQWQSIVAGLESKGVGKRRVKLSSWFKHTAIVILDESLAPLGWTWLLNSPEVQLHREGGVSPGAADAFAPSRSKLVWDARLFNIGPDHLYVTYACLGCSFSVSQLHITVDRERSTEPLGAKRLHLRKLQAWAVTWNSYPRKGYRWLQGRNQALFVSEEPGRPPEVMVQPWLGLVGSFGEIAPRGRQIECDGSFDKVKLCGAHLGKLQLWLAPTGRLSRVYNNSATELPALSLQARRLSVSANLLPVQMNATCHAILGIGHLHRGFGGRGIRDPISGFPAATRRSSRRRGARHSWHQAAAAAAASEPMLSPSEPPLPQQPFQFGFYYTHFFYTLEPHPPHRMLATSSEFCLSAAHEPADCESVQFISGITLNATSAQPQLVLSYGTSDCRAKFAGMRLDRVWQMLQPMPSANAACVVSHGAAVQKLQHPLEQGPEWPRTPRWQRIGQRQRKKAKAG